MGEGCGTDTTIDKLDKLRYVTMFAFTVRFPEYGQNPGNHTPATVGVCGSCGVDM
jgi:hypothetical protein